MIVLDTNVLSALMLDRPDPQVVQWLDLQAAESIWITSITYFEAQFGILRLAKGRRQRSLIASFAALLDNDLSGRILDFDRPAATEAAALAAGREKTGRPVDVRDTQIAGIVLARRASLATGNTRHFKDAGLRLIDPWSTATKN